ncbi:MAG: prefoldin subunit beta [Methanobrevibacter sp.]|jgi:prefoldin beta subunit|nr:prefoldin subunit beta [Candidatus Methanovirga basalitermitum]
MEIPQQIQDQITNFQKLQQQAQAVTVQKRNIEIQIQETKTAFEELKKTDSDATVYKTAGSLLIKVKQDEMTEKLKENIETLELREKTVSRQEEKVLNKLQEMQRTIQESMKEAGIQ